MSSIGWDRKFAAPLVHIPYMAMIMGRKLRRVKYIPSIRLELVEGHISGTGGLVPVQGLDRLLGSLVGERDANLDAS